MSIFNNKYPEFSNSARVWVYVAEKELSQDQAEFMAGQAKLFCDDWKSHGAAVKAKSIVFENRVLIFIADEDVATIGGCSIDSSVNFVKSMGQQFSTDFFNRMLCSFIDDGKLKVVPVTDINGMYDSGVINADTKILNTLVKNKTELEESLFIPFSESWYTRMINQGVC